MTYMPYEDEEFLEAARRIADELGLEVVVVNVNSLRGRIKAKMAGVKRFPALKVGDTVLDGPLDEGRLRELIVRALGQK